MATLHGYVNTARICATNVDAYNCDGIYTAADVDNGVLVTLGQMNLDAQSNIDGFEYTVTLASANSKGVWLVATPEVGYTIEQQMLADPRYFTNAAGRPMSLRYLVPGVDVIEVTKECFTDATLPDAADKKYVIIGADGKMTATNADQAGTQGAYFTFEGYGMTSFGQDNEKTAFIRVTRN